MKKLSLFCLLITIILLITSCSNSKTPISYDKNGIPNLKGYHLIAYVATRQEVGEALLSSFCEQRGCTYELMKLSAEEIVRRVTEERHDPKADVVIGGTLDAHIALKSKHLLTPVSIKHKNSLSREFYDPENYWFGYEFNQLAIAVNLENWQMDISDPRILPSLSLQNLTDERFKGKIVIPDPNFSGTAFTLFLLITQTMNKSDALSFVKKLSKNTKIATINGFMPGQMVGSGEYLLGINFIGDQRMLREAGLPIKSIRIKGPSLSINGLSRLKNAPNGQVANLFIDYCLSNDAAKIIERVSYGTPISKASKHQLLFHSDISFLQTVQRTKSLIEYWNSLRLSE
ncbi:extracellular solute-binding protein [Priestia aryabhattai]|uniref:extracellular solute-binding protein n=1 Tax=Priestia aryabhattai TaxID=412384 RepID=UPI001CCE9EBC|nr:extracellular solute-binding protein [Priestia aryabhattai]MBZ6485121.1 ABC transporter substrate-binding protein [Priestia aryabhattai]